VEGDYRQVLLNEVLRSRMVTFLSMHTYDSVLTPVQVLNVHFVTIRGLDGAQISISW